jgi:hypothetical protein
MTAKGQETQSPTLSLHRVHLVRAPIQRYSQPSFIFLDCP